MSHSSTLRQSVRAALTLGAAASLGTGVAVAQTAAPASATATNLSKIVVTGSHIPETSVATSQPIVTISRQEIDASGFTNLGQVLQSLSSAGASFNNMSTGYIGPYNPSSGYFDLNLYNLGAQRVLILVNGKRWIPTLSGSVNLSTIPLAAISRIDVLLDGASAIYGSSAVSGVVNVITTSNYNGAEASAYYGGYYAKGVGGGWDGQTQRYTATLGVTSDRAGLMLSASYSEDHPIWATNRTISAVPQVGFPVSEFGTSYQPDGALLQLVGPTGPAGCQYPHACVANADGIHPYGKADRYNYRDVQYLTIPSENWYTYAQGHYDFSPNVTFNSTVVYSHRDTHAAFSPTPLAFGLQGYAQTSGGETLPIGISAANPYNPFGVDLIPASGFPGTSPLASAWCARYGSNNGSCTPNSDLLIISQSLSTQMGMRTTTYESDSFYYTGGFNGYFQAFGNQWTWDLNYVYARNRFNATLGGIQDLTKVQDALGPYCDPNNGCVPLNLFGTGGGITPAMANYVNTMVHSQAGVTQRIYSADVGGNFWNSWYAGPWGAAAGYQYLETDGFFSPDGFVSTGNLTTNTFNPTDGRVGQNAEYAELNIPLARDLPGARDMSIDLANRWTQFHVKGTAGENFEHASTGRVAFKWKPLDQLLLRATWSQSFREPSVSELFAGQAQSFNTYRDPCVTGVPGDTNPPPGTVNCPAVSPTAPYGQIRRISGGNPQLLPEQGTTRQLGFVWSPTFLPGFNFTADYYKAEVLKAVGLLSGQIIIDGCYLQDIQSYCDRIERRGPQMYQLNDSLINTGSLSTNGWTFKIDYKFPSTPIGQFAVHYQANFVKRFVQCVEVSGASGPTSECDDYSGSLAWPMPKHRMRAAVDWSYGPWSVFWNIQLIGAMWEPCQPNATLAAVDPSLGWCSNPNKYAGNEQPGAGPNGQNHLGTTIYNDLQANYTVSAWNTTFTLGVNNIFNKDIPISRYYGNPQTFYYRIPGRFLYGRVTVRF